MHFVCDQCYYQFACSQPARAEELTRQVETVKRIYDHKLLSEAAYHDLLKLLISAYIGNQVATSVSHRINLSLNQKLSPHRILESLAFAT